VNRGPFGRASAAAPRAVFGGALPKSEEKRLPSGITRDFCSLEPFPGEGAKNRSSPRTPDTLYQIAPGVRKNYSQNAIPPTALPSAGGDGGAGRRPHWDRGAGRRPAAGVVDPGGRSWRSGRVGAGKLWSRLHGPARLSSTEARSWRRRTVEVAGEDDSGSRRSQGAAVGGDCGGGI
jgi:hypothetical protein